MPEPAKDLPGVEPLDGCACCLGIFGCQPGNENVQGKVQLCDDCLCCFLNVKKEWPAVEHLKGYDLVLCLRRAWARYWRNKPLGG